MSSIGRKVDHAVRLHSLSMADQVRLQSGFTWARLDQSRVKMNADGTMPAPPYQLVDNEGTWLTKSDLVFIDPVGTGYSRAARPDLAQKFFGLQGDIESVGEFIRMYLTRYERWTSPLFPRRRKLRHHPRFSTFRLPHRIAASPSTASC